MFVVSSVVRPYLVVMLTFITVVTVVAGAEMLYYCMFGNVYGMCWSAVFFLMGLLSGFFVWSANF